MKIFITKLHCHEGGFAIFEDGSIQKGLYFSMCDALAALYKFYPTIRFLRINVYKEWCFEV